MTNPELKVNEERTYELVRRIIINPKSRKDSDAFYFVDWMPRRKGIFSPKEEIAIGPFNTDQCMRFMDKGKGYLSFTGSNGNYYQMTINQAFTVLDNL